MKLKQIRVESFGKLEDLTLDLTDGLNRFCHPNEFGKSTLMTFVYFIFFGYESKWMKSYFPWKGGSLSGSIIFSLDGKDYQIFRHHPQKGAEKQQVMDLSGGRELVLAAKEKPGPKLLGLDGETFMRTFFVRQGELFFDRTDGLDTALKNMAATGDENASFQQAMEYLTKEHNRYRYRTRAQGPLLDLQTAILEKSERLSLLEQALEERIAEKQVMDELEREKAALEERLSALEGRLSQSAKNDAARRLLALSRQTPQKEPRSSAEDELLLAQQRAFDALAQAEEELKLKKEQAEQLQREHQHEQQRLEAFYLPADTKEKLEKLSRGDKGGLIIGSLLILLAIGCGVGGNFFPPLWIGGILFGALGIFFLMRQSLACKQFCHHCGAADLKNLQERWAQYELARQQIGAIEAEQAEKAALMQEGERMVAQCRAQLQAISLQTRLLTLEELKEEQFDRAVMRRAAENERRSREELLQGKTMDELQREAEGGDPEGETYSFVFEEKKELLSQLEKKIDALSGKDLYALADLWKKAEELRAELSQERRQEQEWKAALSRAQCAMRWLEDANEDMAQRFAPQLCKKAGEYLALLTHGAYRAVRMDEQYNIRLETDAGAYPTAHFSGGTKDAVYFAFRLAVGGLISERALPLMLDDPFVNLDETRLAKAQELLEEAASGRQILYFTCR